MPASALGSLSWAATDYAENYTGRVLLTSTLELTLERFGDVIRLPGSPVTGVTSIEYVGTDGVTTTLDASLYRVTSKSEPTKITRAYSASWPTPRAVSEAVTITYTAGYGDTLESAPEAIQHAVLLMVEHYHDPEAKAAMYQADRLLNQYKLGAFAAHAGLDNPCALATTESY